MDSLDKYNPIGVWLLGALYALFSSAHLWVATGGGVSVGGLVNILAGTWAEATYNGSTWAITGQGAVWAS